MYTVLWQESVNGEYKDRWDRFESKEEVEELLETLEDDPNVCETDTWIFPPKADEFAVDPERFREE